MKKEKQKLNSFTEDNSFIKRKKIYKMIDIGFIVVFCGTAFSSIAGLVSSTIYSIRHDNFMDEINSTPAIIERLNEEEETATNLYNDQIINSQEYLNRINNINSDENKFAIAQELNQANARENLQKIEIAKDATEGSCVALALNGVGLLTCAGLAIATELKKEKDEEYEFEF